MTDIRIISDDLDRSGPLQTELSFLYWVEMFSLEAAASAEPDPGCLLVIDCNIGNVATLVALKALMAKVPNPEKSLFLADGWNFSGRMPANLGGGRAIKRSAPLADLVREINGLLREINPMPASREPAEVHAVLDWAGTLSYDINVAARAGDPLPKPSIEEIGEEISRVLKNCGIDTWIDAVRSYHSHTYRHSMLVTGHAVVFGQHLDLAPEDIKLLAITALVHDVGKVMIPLRILDKPGKLTREEFDEIKLHPVYSREILVRDGQFSNIIIDAAAQHHEYIDGTGYPEGLQGRQISPLVRMLTIVDIYSALTEERSYKRAYTPREAYQILTEMEPKLDTRLLTAFRPVVLDVAFARSKNRLSGGKAPILAAARVHPLDQVATT